MFLGQNVDYSRSGDQLNSFDPNMVGAVHFSQLGHTNVKLSGGTVNQTYKLRDGYNLLTFPNTALNSLTFTWTGTGSVDWSTLRVYKTDISLVNAATRDLPYNYNETFSFPENALYSTEVSDYAELAFEWRYLSWERVSELRVLFNRHGVLGNPRFWLIPDQYEGERYDVIITSPFNFYQSSQNNFSAGASGALVFETVADLPADLSA